MEVKKKKENSDEEGRMFAGEKVATSGPHNAPAHFAIST